MDGPYTVADVSIYPTFDTGGLGYLITAHTTDANPASGGEREASSRAGPTAVSGRSVG
jgi:hypothetical protein